MNLFIFTVLEDGRYEDSICNVYLYLVQYAHVYYVEIKLTCYHLCVLNALHHSL